MTAIDIPLGLEQHVQTTFATPTFTIIRVSREDQLRGYGPDAQWEDDVLPNSANLGLLVEERNRRIIRESATGWNRPKFEEAVKEAINLHIAGQIHALLFPRVDRETRFLFASFPILCDAIQSGLKVYFARERLRLDPDDSESLSRYLRKAEESQAYVETMRLNTMQGRLSNYLKTVRRQTRRYHRSPQASCNRPRKLDAFLS